MLYYPDTPPPSEVAAASASLFFWPSFAGYRGFLGAQAPAKPKSTVVAFHGNGGGAADRAWYARALQPLGYRVVLAEYPVYGGRPGTLGEEAFVADARETVRQVAAELGGPVLLLGESLGCGVAAAVAKDPPVPVTKLLLITPWDNLLSVAQAHFPFIPLGFFLKDRYDSAANLKGFEGRVALVAAERDEVIPIRHARNLYDGLACAKRLWVVPQAGHNDWMLGVARDWWAEVMEFVEAGGG
ncbi:MAG: alpha/beta fold hydrolase [Deltaproteobacteria bacterium]|nr:alpha/beta fold hydrolase [Deltaproteobacteria bacterium]